MRMLPDLEYVSVAEVKAKLSEKLRRVSSHGRRFAITSHGKPKAVLLSYKNYIALLEKRNEGEIEKISIDEWKKDAKRRKKIVDSVSSLFDLNKLSRKRQRVHKGSVVCSKRGK